MKLHLRYLAFAVLACLLLATAGCDKDKGNAGGGLRCARELLSR